jgi:propionyl-CoA synthetase
VFGPLINGSTTVLFEGKPVGTPDAAVYWDIVERYKVNVLFTAPTALRAIRAIDPDLALARIHDHSSLRTLFVAGERADPDTMAFFQNRLASVDVVDNWWQTETGTPICGFATLEERCPAGSTGLPLPGWEVAVLDTTTGEELPRGVEGPIAIKLPMPPGALTSVYNNEALFHEAYMEDYPGYYSTSDIGTMDAHGHVTVLGRSDDVINVSGHRLSTGQLEEVICSHPAVVECACLGSNDALKGQVPVALVVLAVEPGPPASGTEVSSATDDDGDSAVLQAIRLLVRQRIGPWAAPHTVCIVQRLPKTRSGKILRNVMRAICDGAQYRLPGTIEDPSVVDAVKASLAAVGLPQHK